MYFFGFITVLILLGVMIYILEPYFTGKKLPDRFITSRQIEQISLTLKRDEITECMKELEQDFGTGKVTENDYNTLIQEYSSDLKKLVAKLSVNRVPRNRDDLVNQIEAEVRLFRRSTSESGEEQQKVFCNQCGKENPAGSNFCSNCGKKIS